MPIKHFLYAACLKRGIEFLVNVHLGHDMGSVGPAAHQRL